MAQQYNGGNQGRENSSGGNLGSIIFWKDKAGKIPHPDLFSKTAEDWAIKNAVKGTENNPTQVRKFYDELVIFQSRLVGKEADFEKYLPYIRMVKAKTAYAKGRKLISDDMKEFLDQSIDAIKDPDDFKLVVSFMEAFMGYFKYHKK